MSCKKSMCTLGIGMVAGATMGVLFAPKSGKETRECLKETLDNMQNKVKRIDAKEVKKYVEKSIKKLKREIDNLSLEKVSKMAKKKAKGIEQSIEDLISYVKENGTPILEDAVMEVKSKASDVINSLNDNEED